MSNLPSSLDPEPAPSLAMLPLVNVLFTVAGVLALVAGLLFLVFGVSDERGDILVVAPMLLVGGAAMIWIGRVGNCLLAIEQNTRRTAHAAVMLARATAEVTDREVEA